MGTLFLILKGNPFSDTGDIFLLRIAFLQFNVIILLAKAAAKLLYHVKSPGILFSIRRVAHFVTQGIHKNLIYYSFRDLKTKLLNLYIKLLKI